MYTFCFSSRFIIRFLDFFFFFSFLLQCFEEKNTVKSWNGISISCSRIDLWICVFQSHWHSKFLLIKIDLFCHQMQNLIPLHCSTFTLNKQVSFSVNSVNFCKIYTNEKWNNPMDFKLGKNNLLKFRVKREKYSIGRE